MPRDLFGNVTRASISLGNRKWYTVPLSLSQVVSARILRSVPLLDEAVLDAVRQWQYTPTLLNGVPVPVIMTVTVQFTLTR